VAWTVSAFFTAFFIALIKILAVNSPLRGLYRFHDTVFGKDRIKALPKTNHPYQRRSVDTDFTHKEGFTGLNTVYKMVEIEL
jgi:hypothetical protein